MDVMEVTFREAIDRLIYQKVYLSSPKEQHQLGLDLVNSIYADITHF